MAKKPVLVFIFVCLALVGCDSDSVKEKLRIKLTPPEQYSPDDTVHIVGNFNDWELQGANAYELEYENGLLTTLIPVTESNIFFSFVKNRDWQYMPANEKGKSRCTYLYQAKNKTAEVQINLTAWKGDKARVEPEHTLTGSFQHHKDFYMPQLSRKGDISIYLPKSYDEQAGTTYPVLYMLDGQNVFDEYTAYSDEWGIDEIIEKLTSSNELAEMIVVAIPNGPRRWNEYNPWRFKNSDGKESKGEGGATISFIKDTLKPFIDKNYRTKPESNTTGLAGSSLGGLMALYAGLAHGDVFGFVGAFSPALAIENMKGNNVLFEAIEHNTYSYDSRIYVDIGKIEYGNYEKIEALKRLLLGSGLPADNLKLVKDDLGRHCEMDWSKRFPDAIRWMTNKITSTSPDFVLK